MTSDAVNPGTPLSADAALRQLRGAVAHCLDEADHLPEGTLLSQRWSIDAFDALRRFEALDDLVTRHGHLPTDWHPSRPTTPAVPHQVCRQEPGEDPTHPSQENTP